MYAWCSLEYIEMMSMLDWSCYSDVYSLTWNDCFLTAIFFILDGTLVLLTRVLWYLIYPRCVTHLDQPLGEMASVNQYVIKLYRWYYPGNSVSTISISACEEMYSVNPYVIKDDMWSYVVFHRLPWATR